MIDIMTTGKWLILQLSETCNLEQQVDEVVNEIKASFGDDAVYYVPIKTENVENKKISNVLFDGYVFVKCSDENFLINGVNNISGPYFRPLTYDGKFQFAKDSDIQNFNQSIEEKIDNSFPKVGETITPKEGVFKDMRGEVLKINREDKSIIAIFRMPSREVTTTIKVINLKL